MFTDEFTFAGRKCWRIATKHSFLIADQDQLLDIYTLFFFLLSAKHTHTASEISDIKGIMVFFVFGIEKSIYC